MKLEGFRRSPTSQTFDLIDPHCGRVEKRERPNVCILGAASHEDDGLIPWFDTSWEVWGCNGLWQRAMDAEGLFRADRWFELHPRSVQTDRDMDWIQCCPIPLYTLEYAEWAPTSVKYPLHDVMAYVGLPYFTNTFAYQVALAIAEGFTTIRLCNIWLQAGRELCVERACLEFWLGLAWGRGIKVDQSPHSSLLRHPFLYGYEYWDEKRYVEDMMKDRLNSFASDAYAGSK